MDGLWTEVCGRQKQSNDPHNNQHNPQYANDWAPLTRKRHIPPHPAQPRRTNDWAPRTRKRHQREHRPQRPTERSDPTQHAKGRTGDCPGPCKGTTTRRHVTWGGGGTTAFGAVRPRRCGVRTNGGAPSAGPWHCGPWLRRVSARPPVGAPGVRAVLRPRGPLGRRTPQVTGPRRVSAGRTAQCTAQIPCGPSPASRDV